MDEYMAKYYPFTGCNEEFEIESYGEFLTKTEGKDPSELHFDNWVFQSVDLSLVSLEDWEKYNLSGALFMSCTFPPGITPKCVRMRGASVWEQVEGVPFLAHRGYMYTQDEIQQIDDEITKHSKENGDFITVCAQGMHDWSITDALGDFLEGKSPVTFLGGHRNSHMYRQVVLLARKLAKRGFIIVTGGGAGVAEAGSLGGYLIENTDEEVEEALKIISQEGFEQFDKEPANQVIARFGPVSTKPSVCIGVPTFSRNWGPTNQFSSWIAKYFSSAIRDEVLLKIGIGGMIFCEGSGGTRQKLFQAACRNHYCEAVAVVPMILFGTHYWEGPSHIGDVFRKCAKGRHYERWILSTDDGDKVVDVLTKHARSKILPRASSSFLREKSLVFNWK